jgi:hypothetical protein
MHQKKKNISSPVSFIFPQHIYWANPWALLKVHMILIIYGIDPHLISYRMTQCTRIVTKSRYLVLVENQPINLHIYAWLINIDQWTYICTHKKNLYPLDYTCTRCSRYTHLNYLNEEIRWSSTHIYLSSNYPHKSR